MTTIRISTIGLAHRCRDRPRRTSRPPPPSRTISGAHDHTGAETRSERRTMLDDHFAADDLAQRAVDLVHDREAAETIDVMTDSDAIAAVALATVAAVKRLAIVGDQLDQLTEAIKELSADAVKRDLHAERLARDRAESEIEECRSRIEAEEEAET